MYLAFPIDIPGPGLVYAIGGGLLALVFISILITLLEFLVLWRMGWGKWYYSLLAAFLTNIGTTTLGATVVVFTMSLGFIGLLIDFSLSVVVEALILMLLKRGAARQNWLASLAANTVSYLLIILPLFFVLGLLNP